MPVAETALDLDRDPWLAAVDDRTEHVREATCGLAWPVLVGEPSPEGCKWVAELQDEPVRDLALRASSGG